MKFKQLLLILTITMLALVGCSNAEAIEETTDVSEEVIRESIEVFGLVKSNDLSSVNVDLELKVLEVLKSTGDSVSSKDKILRFDKTLVDDQVAIYRQELDLISSQMDQADITTLQLKNALSEANSSLKVAEDKYKNDKTLEASGILSKASLDQSKENYNQALSRVKDLRLSVENSQASSQQSDQESIIAYNKLAKKIEDIEKVLNNKTIIEDDYLISHIENGVVTDLNLLAGEYITPKQTIYKLVDNKDLYIEAEVSEEFIKDISIGQEVEITPLFDKSRTVIGTVEKINGLPFVKNGETIVIIEISFDDIQGFMPNFNVDVTIYLD